MSVNYALLFIFSFNFRLLSAFIGGAENASMEIVSTRGWKMQVRKRPVQTARVEIASMEKASTDRNCGNLKYGKRKYKTSRKVGKRRYGENCECKPSLQHV